MSDIYDELEQWFKDRPIWIQEGTRLLIENENIYASHINYLYELCMKEARGESITFSTVKREQLCFGDVKETIRIDKISDVSGINDLAPKNPLVFKGNNLSVVYGGNGSGKSGYARILKHICGAKHLGKLLGNVFKSDVDKMNCKITIKKDGKDKEIPWEPSIGILKELSSVEIFDSGCADVYATKENEVAYEPFILRLFTRITELCIIISENFDSEISSSPSQKPKLPRDYIESIIGKWYENISSNTKDKDVENQCSWDDKDDAELKSITERLLIANPLEKAKTIRRTMKNAQELKHKIENGISGLNNNCIESILKVKKEAEVKRNIVVEDAKKIFDNAPLEGVGGEAWKAMWNAAREYSINFAYKNIPFPNLNEGARCVLCQQKIVETENEPVKTRLQSFEIFVKGNLEKQAIDAENEYRKVISSLPIIAEISDVDNYIDAAGITDEKMMKDITTLFESLRNRKKWILSTSNNSEAPEIAEFDYSTLFNVINSSYEKLALQFESDASGENRESSKIKENDLKAKKWIFEQRDAIINEIDRLKKIETLKKAQKLTNTKQLSTKKSNISDSILSSEYLKRFKDELKNLGASKIKVEIIKTRADRGKIFHQLVITNKVKPGNLEEVLSQGEYRIVSLAAFLADAMGRAGNSPFIFDDPISSLDQEFEEKLVERLIELSKSRQVIVFTHRLSMLSSLVDGAAKAAVDLDEVCIRAETWGKGEPSETSFFVKKPIKVLNKLKNERIPVSKNILNEKGKLEYDYIAKGICSDFRILIERIIENELLAEVVLRFRRSIITKDKICQLAKINSDDCKMLDDMMTKYSKYEHSQPQENPVDIPPPDEIEADIAIVLDWIQKFKERLLN